MTTLVLALSTVAHSTRMALFRGEELVRSHVAAHAGAELRSRRDQRTDRATAVREFLADAGVAAGSLGAVVGRGGMLRRVDGGTYRICDALLREAERGGGGDLANLAATIAHEIAAEWGCPAFAVDPEGGDERETLSRLSQGNKIAVPRAPALAMKAAARRYARAVERPVEGIRAVIANLGTTVSLCAQRAGRMVDVVELWHPATERGGAADAAPDAVGPEAANSGDFDFGARATSLPDLEDMLGRAERGDSRASLALQAAAYRIAKAVGELATVLEGEVDAVLLTGRLANAGPIVAEICRRVEWIAPVFVYREEDELGALADCALRVLRGEELAKRYA